MPDRKKDRIEEISLGENSIGDLFDISEDGIGYHSDCAYDKGAVLEVALNDVKLNAQVMYCTPMVGGGAHLGLKYIHLLSAQAEALYEVVSGISKGAPAKFSIIGKIR